MCIPTGRMHGSLPPGLILFGLIINTGRIVTVVGTGEIIFGDQLRCTAIGITPGIMAWAVIMEITMVDITTVGIMEAVIMEAVITEDIIIGTILTMVEDILIGVRPR